MMAIYSQLLFGPTESKILCMRGYSMFENRENSAVSAGCIGGTVREGLWP
jgi:hypothetical protein